MALHRRWYDPHAESRGQVAARRAFLARQEQRAEVFWPVAFTLSAFESFALDLSAPGAHRKGPHYFSLLSFC